MMKRVVVEMGRRYKKSLYRSSVDVAQPIVRLHIVLNGDVFDERAEISEESR
jgi:hypothetical protein